MFSLFYDRDFMESFTTVHFTWLLFAPCFVCILGIFILGVLNVFDNSQILGGVFLMLLFSCFLSVKVFSTLDKAPFIKERMHQFGSGPVHVDSEQLRKDKEKEQYEQDHMSYSEKYGGSY